MKKRLLSICLVLALCLTCVPSALAVGDVHFSGGDGTPSSPYLISNAQDLFALADAVNNGLSYEDQYFRLTKDIDLEGKPWTPIGDRLDQDGRQFLGTFDGNDHTVSGLCVEGAYGSGGLFGFVGMMSQKTTAEVKNLNVVGSVSVARPPANFYVAGIAGFVGQGAEITNCSFEGTITATIKSEQSGQGKSQTVLIGGIAGYNFGTISKCTVSNSAVSGTNESAEADNDVYVAGIAANNTGGTISECAVNNSTITGTNNSNNQASQSLAGGIAAFNTLSFLENIKGTIENCKVTGGSVSTVGTVKVSSVGGIAAVNEGTVTGCSNSASVTGNNALPIAQEVSLGSGGVVGSNKHLVEGCSNSGSVTGNGLFTGGVVGYNTTNEETDGTISASHNTGTVKGEQYVGGVVGNNHTVVKGCYNTGEVTSTGDYAGGVVGRNTYYYKNYFPFNPPDAERKGEISTSYNTGAVSGGSYVGGVAGYNCVTIAQCFNTGSVTGSKNYTGGVVGCNAYYIDDRFEPAVVKKYPGEIQNTYNAGAVTGVHYVGGVVGEQQGGEVEGQKKGTCAYSHNYGAVSSNGQAKYIGGVFGHLGAYASANECYYLEGTAGSCGQRDFSATVTNVESKTLDQFASGEVAFLLEEPNAASQVWGQQIGTDKYPVFTDVTDGSSKNVLRVTFKNTVEQYAYANPNGTVDVPENTDTVPSGKVYCWVDASHTRYTDTTHIFDDVTLTPVLAYTIDYEAKTAVAAGDHKISTDNTNWHDDAEAPIPIEPGQTLFVKHPDNQSTEETLPSRPASPDTVRGGTNQITGVTAAMEYRLSGASTWTACTGTAITGLPAGAYQVRIKATSTSFASESVTVQVSQYTPPVVPTYPPAVEEPENGTVTTSPSRPKEGDRVTITPKPDEGFEVDEVVVEDADGNEIEVTQNQDGTYSFTQPDGKVTITVTFRCDGGELCPSGHLTDVEEDGWYHDAVDYVVEHGIMEGMSPTTFAPRRELTRAEVVQVLYNLEGRPDVTGENIFTDTAKHWAVDPITWAATTGVVDGYGDDTFRPNNPVSRQEFAQMLYRYAKYKGYDLAAEGDLSQFPDSGKIGEWAEVAMKWANGEGLIQGHENGTIDPTGTTIRAQAASILMRFDLNLVQQ